MDYRPLGRTGLKISPLCLGTMNFGLRTDKQDSFAIMDRALRRGIQFFDTADIYGGKRGEGITEKIIGEWFAQGDGRRDQVVLATKVYGEARPENCEDPNLARGLSARKIIQCCEASLKRLQTDRIDLYQMHHVDRAVPWDEIWQAMEILTQQGKILYVGSSNFAGWDIATACHEARGRNFLGLVCEQSKYSLATRSIELEVIPACRHYGLGLIPWSPLGGGMLGGCLKQSKEGRRGTDGVRAQIEAKHSQIQKWEALCEELGQFPGETALAWLLHNPVVSAPIIGPRTLEQLESAVRALDITLEADTLTKIDAIWPGPGGEAPAAYAW